MLSFSGLVNMQEITTLLTVKEYAAQLKLILLTNDENTEELDPTSNVAAYEMF